MKQSVRAMYDVYLTKHNFSPKTTEIKDRAIARFIEHFGDRAVSDVDYSVAEDYKMILVKSYQLSQSAANTYLRVIKPFFGWMVRRGYIVGNPFDDIKTYKVKEKIREVFEADELERIFEVAGIRWQAIVVLGLMGLRRGEVLNLTVTDLRLDKSYLKVTSKRKSVTTWPFSIKGHAERLVPFPEAIPIGELIVYPHKIAVSLIESLSASQPYLCIKSARYEHLMSQQLAGCLRYDDCCNPWGNFNRDFKRLLKKAGVSHKDFHSLRRTFGTQMCRHFDIKSVQTLLGHSSVQTTARYYNVVDQQNLVARCTETVGNCYASNVP